MSTREIDSLIQELSQPVGAVETRSQTKSIEKKLKREIAKAKKESKAENPDHVVKLPRKRKASSIGNKITTFAKVTKSAAVIRVASQRLKAPSDDIEAAGPIQQQKTVQDQVPQKKKQVLKTTAFQTEQPNPVKTPSPRQTTTSPVKSQAKEPAKLLLTLKDFPWYRVKSKVRGTLGIRPKREPVGYL